VRRRDLHLLNPPAEWTAAAEKAAEKIRKGKKPDGYSAMWSALKSQLADISFKKCWYCESRQTRDDNAVDHFRPKSKYSFLAVTPENFRYSCTFCNSRRTNPATGVAEGKGDFFPLFNGSPMAKRVEDVRREDPILLDPCVATDPGLLDFHANGMPCPKDPEGSRDAQRVLKSIELYHLDHPDLVEERRRLALHIADLIRDADELYPRVQAGGDPVSDGAFKRFAQLIARCIDDRSVLSAFARRMVMAHRDKPWIERVLAG